jgi:hypothetical protein
VIGKDGTIWAASTNEVALPIYNFQYEDDNGKTINIQVDETKCLLAGFIKYIQALNNTDDKLGGVGVPPSKDFPYGLRIGNVKYYLSSRDNETNLIYYKSVIL